MKHRILTILLCLAFGTVCNAQSLTAVRLAPGKADAAFALQASLDSMAKDLLPAKRLVVGDGRKQVIMLSQPLRIYAGTEMVADGTITLYCQGSAGIIATGDGIVIRGFRLDGGEVPDKPRGRHGVVVKGHVTLDGNTITNFDGNGVHVVADKNYPDKSNANDCRFVRNTVLLCYNGFYLQGGDANASVAEHNYVADCTEWGYWDNSLLGNSWNNCVSENNGVSRFNRTLVSYKGQRYHATDTAVPANTEPGVTPGWRRYWHQRGPGEPNWQFKAWKAGERYHFGGDYAATNPNNFATFTNCYNEEFLAFPNVAYGRAEFRGGLAAHKVRGATSYASEGIINMSGLRVGMGSEHTGNAIQYKLMPPTTGAGWGLGGLEFFGGTPWPTRIGWDSTIGGPAVRFSGMDEISQHWPNRQTPNAALGRGEDGALGFETAGFTKGILLHDNRGAKRLFEADAPPAMGHFVPGDFCLNSAPSEGEPFGWRFVAPGSWEALYAIPVKPRRYQSHAEADADAALRSGASYWLKNGRTLYVKP